MLGSPTTLVRQLVRYAGVGVASTAFSLVLYASLRMTIEVQAANLIASLVSGVVNTGANRRFTFGSPGLSHVVRHYAEGLGLVVIGLGLTAGALAGLQYVDPQPSRVTELVVVVAASAVGGLLRFTVLRGLMTPTPGPGVEADLDAATVPNPRRR